MAMKEKYKGMVLEGKWAYAGKTSRHNCALENIYNHSRIELSMAQMDRVIEGLDTIGHIMTRRIKISSTGANGLFKYGNEHQKWWARKKSEFTNR